MIPLFIRSRSGLAFFAFLAIFSSGFGQTFFVSVMGGEIREACGLADAWPLSRITLLALTCLAAGCLLIGTAPHIAVLGLGFVLIRFGGQGYISHLGIITAARYFPGNKGKAVALAASGIPVAEALLPAGAVLVMGLASWRWSWMAGACILVLFVLPVLLYLARHTPAPVSDRTLTSKTESGLNHTRKQVLQDPGFYMILPAAVVTPFVVTAILFHQVAIAEIQGWTLQVVATAFSCYAAGHLGACRTKKSYQDNARSAQGNTM
jgi:hypothetical protein